MLLSQHMILLISLWLLFNIVPLGSHATIINNNNINNNDFHTNIINKLIPNPISIPFHHNYNQRTTPPFRPVHQRSFTESFQNNEYSFTFYVDTFNPIHEQQHCGSSPSQACPSLLKAFQQLNDQLELRNISMSIPSNLTSNISVQFYIMNDEFNFCFADFMTPPRHTIEYSFKFVGVPNNVTGMYPQVQCSKDLPFNRSDISLLDFSFLNAQTLYIFSCTPIEMRFTNCNIVNSVFLLAQFVESIQQVYRDVCGSASADSQMSTMDSFKSWTFSHSLTFQNVTIENTLVMCSFMKTITLSNVIQKQLMTTFSFENSEKVEMIDYVIHDGLFCKITNVESVRIDRMIYVAQRFTFYMRGVIQLFVSNSQFLSYIMLDAGLFSLERLDHVQIKNCRVNGLQYTWLHCRDVTSLELENLQVTNNRVQSTVSSTLNIITIEDLISFSLKHSYFDSNYGLHGNDLLIHSHANIHIYNNTFRNGWSFTRGGSCSLGMSKSQYVFGGSMTNITGNMFENNYCHDVGGAIFMTAAYVLILEHNTFINNTARIRGGAVAIDGLIRADLSLTGSRFDNNRVLTNSLIQTNTMGIMGSGGAIYLSSPKCTSLKAYFSNNSALRGGAIFIHQQPNMPDVIHPCLIRESIFENNQALNAGGALYFSNIKNVNDLIETKSVKFINNHAKIFGNDMASTIQQFTVTELLPKTVYPGQNISISVHATDIFHRWTPLETQLFSLQLINSNQFLLDFSLNGSIITLNLKQVSTENFSTSQNISILPENILLPTWISVHVIPCPQGMIASERGFQGQNCLHLCEK
ncbi:hypothetical protein C9374_013524 [Naegleria lovaniensis]|uniref:Right handed beta helix domain-containing protein n=1 Tax=Naegleria lovaniensis TaxID=51637 RepID=A0AA88GWW3_NAELO|nr:uncharacterized protein C9374_013524 [Naegleria lovaniensis]KAG2392039.1 hypothetical protein C9374_013524 [Naegleria lovaniensis]